MIEKLLTIDDVVAGIVTYNPEIDRLKDNIAALAMQVCHLVIVDNGSQNFAEIEKIFKDEIGISVYVIHNCANEGIAQALSQIMNFAEERNFLWALTLDQDSVIEQGLVNEYINLINMGQYYNAAMLTCLIHDRNFKDEKYEQQSVYVKEVPYCITSAAFTNVEKYKTTAGYDKLFFIDSVDFDMCYTFREFGYQIFRINYNGLYHEVGHGENRRFLWKEIVVYHHKPFRTYYSVRNTVWMHIKHPRMFGKAAMLKKLFTKFARIIIYEDNKSEKLKNFWMGLRDSRGYKQEV